MNIISTFYDLAWLGIVYALFTIVNKTGSTIMIISLKLCGADDHVYYNAVLKVISESPHI